MSSDTGKYDHHGRGELGTPCWPKVRFINDRLVIISPAILANEYSAINKSNKIKQIQMWRSDEYIQIRYRDLHAIVVPAATYPGARLTGDSCLNDSVDMRVTNQ
jgi:hypothetical protein